MQHFVMDFKPAVTLAAGGVEAASPLADASVNR
jgi:hypothetical protein